MEIIKRIQGRAGETVVWRGKDAEGRTVFGATRSRDGVAVEPAALSLYTQKAALEALRAWDAASVGG